jgi:hypothetical protein
MRDEIKQNMRNRTTWWRALYMLLFTAFFCVAKIVIATVILFQLFTVLFTGSSNERLLILGQNLSTYVYQIMLYLTFNNDEKPYPFGDWPNGPPDEFD